MTSNLSDVFSNVSDPRRPLRRLHKLNDILLISVLAIICGAETWNNIEEYAHAKKAFLTKFLELPNGIPSHDTFNRVFGIINPEEFEQSFMEWVASIVTIKNGELVSIDGKTIRGAKSKGKKSPFHVVSAWAHENNMVLGQLMTDEKSNEITAIPQLIELLELNHTVITIDAMGCQQNIASKIIENEANYILAVKNNQKNLFEDIEFSFNRTTSKKIDVSQTLDGDHGRIETRTCSVISDLGDIENKQKWKNLSSIIKIGSTREFKNSERSTETSIRYYISSVKDNSTYFQHAIRSHWAIEKNSIGLWMLSLARMLQEKE
tara:strand:+ start:716 stop:1675 length:960 start_codon:yes stop_codon:yes gene_type:complete